MILKRLCNQTDIKQNKLNNIMRENIYGLRKKKKSKSDILFFFEHFLKAARVKVD